MSDKFEAVGYESGKLVEKSRNIDKFVFWTQAVTAAMEASPLWPLQQQRYRQ